MDGNLWSRVAPSLLWCCMGPARLGRAVGRRSRLLRGRHVAAMILFQKTAQLAARLVRIICANLEGKGREPQGTSGQLRAVSGSLGCMWLSQLHIAAPAQARAPLPGALTARSHSAGGAGRWPRSRDQVRHSGSSPLHCETSPNTRGLGVFLTCWQDLAESSAASPLSADTSEPSAP